MADVQLLNRINSPDDLKKLKKNELPVLAGDIRSVLIDTVSVNGGHLASNLGAVELTIALHRVFDSPRDTIVWDVGHQSYTHKLLTGRYAQFGTLRKSGGISGFCRPSESEHDAFYSGHSGTSVSSAFGTATAKKLNDDPSYTVAVIGDGSFTGGMVYEAMNNAGRSDCKLIVILNDNEMSISRNVGSVAKYLAAIRAKPKYYRIKAGTEKFLNHIPLIGRRLSRTVFEIKTYFKDMIYSSNLFEDMGFRYMGPIDGHDIDTLTDALNSAKLISRPVLLHINTTKGRGYELAEREPTHFHGVSRFDSDSGEPIFYGANFSDEFGRCLSTLAAMDNRICAITAAMSVGTGLEEFRKRFYDRFYDIGIAEEHALPFAAGLAQKGMIPVFAVYSTFLQRCYDQLVHDAALQKRKVVIAVDRAGFVGEDGETHQGIYDAAFMNSIPDITVYSPSTYEELKAFIRLAVYCDERVVAVRYPRGHELILPKDYKPSCGSFELYGDRSAKTVIVTYGRIFANACDALNLLENKGISARILKLNRIKPIDSLAVTELIDAENIYFFEEGIRSAGVGEKLALMLLEAGYKGGYTLTAVDDCFVPQDSVSDQLKKFKLDADGIFDTIMGGLGVER